MSQFNSQSSPSVRVPMVYFLMVVALVAVASYLVYRTHLNDNSHQRICLDGRVTILIGANLYFELDEQGRAKICRQRIFHEIS